MEQDSNNKDIISTTEKETKKKNKNPYLDSHLVAIGAANCVEQRFFPTTGKR